MPVMDGYEATAKIRALGTDGQVRVPILAMTANSKASDLQRCRDTGMDDVLVKPLSLERVRQALETWVAKSSPEDTQTAPPVAAALSPQQAPAIDDKVAGQLRDALGSGVIAMIDAFLGDTPEYVEQLRVALGQRDLAQLRRVAHAIKGSSANIGAAALADIAALLENSLGGAEQAALEQLVEQLAQEYERAAAVLARIGPPPRPAPRLPT